MVVTVIINSSSSSAGSSLTIEEEDYVSPVGTLDQNGEEGFLIKI